MTAKRDLKSIIRDRQRKTGESYTAAHAHVMRARAELLGIAEEPPSVEQPAGVDAAVLGSVGETSPVEPPVRVEAAVLKVGTSTARIRILGETDQVTLRSRDVWSLAPGHVVTIRIEKRWTYRGDAYASGKIERAQIDVARLGLEPLPLEGGSLENLREHYEHVRRPDPYAPLWRKLTAKPRPWYEMDGIAWGAFPDDGPDHSPTCDAVELNNAGEVDAARDLLMDTLLRDLRCLDAHAHLGTFEFEHSPARAIVHYEIGVRIGELSLPVPFDGVLAWGVLYNRPFLRCLHGYGLCLWRLGRTDEAVRVFERILALNPNDNQGVRFCWYDVREGRTWEEAQVRDELAYAEQAEAMKQARVRLSQKASDDPRAN
jgi:tetratricopeptide (TPR) repeat protein